jgi:hypothetical protein
MEVIIRKSKKKDKQFDAIVDGKKTVRFGSVGMSDMTQHKDPERKQRYINRHKKNENWNDARTAGFYAKHVLWNKTSLQASVNDINKNFPKMKVKLKL